MTMNVHRTHSDNYTTNPEWIEVGTTANGARVSYELAADICGKPTEPYGYNVHHDYPRHTVTRVEWYGICRLSPGHDGDCTNDVTITDCCGRRVDRDDEHGETVSNPEVTVCAIGHGCNKDTRY